MSGLPGWVLGVGLMTSPRNNLPLPNFQKPVMYNRGADQDPHWSVAQVKLLKALKTAYCAKIFIYGLLNGVINISDYVSSCDGMIGE
jgi:hypothetical protein